jgi:uncharacterized protein (DUF302 family)
MSLNREGHDLAISLGWQGLSGFSDNGGRTAMKRLSGIALLVSLIMATGIQASEQQTEKANSSMLYVQVANGTVDQALKKLEEAATANKFGVLTVHDLKQKLNAKGVEFGPECRIVEVCNPKKAKAVLEADMSISNALPCRISIYEEDGKVKVSTLRPTAVLGLFGQPKLKPIAEEVEEAMIRMIDAACD